MRVLQLHTRYRQPGGEDAVVATEAALLRAGGHEVLEHLVDNPEGAVASAGGLALAPYNPVSARRARAAVRRVRPDVVHVHNTWYALSPSVFAAVRDEDAPVVVTLHNYRLLCANALLFRDGRPCEDCVGTHPWHGVQHRCYRDSAVASAVVATTIALHRRLPTWSRDVDVFIALSDFARQRFVAGGLPAEKIVIKPNTVADGGRRQTPPSASKAALFVGRLTPEKGIMELLDVWRSIDHRGVELDVVGSGPLAGEVARRAGAGVTVHGAMPASEVRQRMLESRVLLFPSRWYETFGLVMVEAMAAGLPVVASDLGGSRELIGRDGEGAGWTVEADGWEAALAQWLHDGAALDDAGRRGRARYEAGFSEEAGLRALEAVYADAIRLRPANA